MSSQVSGKLDKLDELVAHASDIISKLKQKIEDPTLQERFDTFLDKIKKLGTVYEPIYTDTLAANLHCLFDFIKNLTKYQIQPNQQSWFDNQITTSINHLKQASHAVIEKNKAQFNALITECVAINDKIHGQELSCFIKPYIQKAFESCLDPTNFSNFYSTFGIIKYYIRLIGAPQNEILKQLGWILSFVRVEYPINREFFKPIEDALDKLTTQAMVIFNPLTSNFVVSDTLQDANDTFTRIAPLMQKISFSSTFEEVEIIEMQRISQLLKSLNNPLMLINVLQSSLSAPLLTCTAIKKYYAHGTNEYSFLSALILAMNTASDFWSKTSENERTDLYNDIYNMFENFILFLENRPRQGKVFKPEMQHLVNQAVTDFNSHYKDLIATTKPHTPAPAANT